MIGHLLYGVTQSDVYNSQVNAQQKSTHSHLLRDCMALYLEERRYNIIVVVCLQILMYILLRIIMIVVLI